MKQCVQSFVERQQEHLFHSYFWESTDQSEVHAVGDPLQMPRLPIEPPNLKRQPIRLEVYFTEYGGKVFSLHILSLLYFTPTQSFQHYQFSIEPHA